ncbi:hypothetical protein L596_019662 [Steinernema carpocapsae]|uniref:Uncharacterized protein n=1 Tax=Steinernema carpocapsae TaxID=34508 RepID=A0A4U5MS08_STECR|nr:hypothetical protein L596_019662 [Steinernema carpocapsae]
MSSDTGNRSVLAVGVFPDFPNSPTTQLIVSSCNLFYITVVVGASNKIEKKNFSRLYPLWLFLSHLPSNVYKIVISVLQLTNVLRSDGTYYRNEHFNFLILL